MPRTDPGEDRSSESIRLHAVDRPPDRELENELIEHGEESSGWILVDPDSALELPQFPRDRTASGIFRHMVCQVLKMIRGQLDVVVAQEYPAASRSFDSLVS